MGDYLDASVNSSDMIAAWGDTRNKCAPPAGAGAPCSPAGRGDQDVWSGEETDSTGVDLSITPWGFVTGVGPTWKSPDIFVVNSSNVQINAEKGVVNLLRARIHNLGNADATGAVVRFRFMPAFGSMPDSDFESVGTVTVNVPAGATQVVPINWDLTNLSDTNGGLWPQPISAFYHFCARVDIEYPSDINLSNNLAQTNFFDVTTASAPVVIHFLIGNPLDHVANLNIFVPQLQKAVVPRPVETLPRPAGKP